MTRSWLLVLLTLLAAACTNTPQSGSGTTAPVAAPDPELAARLAAPRPIAAGKSYWLEELTWMEVRDAIADGTTTIIIPTGGIEENGPYLATGKHNLILEGTCPVIAAQLVVQPLRLPQTLPQFA